MPRSADSTAAPFRRGKRHGSIPLALTALAYCAAAWAASWLGTAPSYASPLNPAAGIALASVLVYGRRMLAGVLLGSLAAAFALRAALGDHGTAAFALPFVIAAAAVLQAGFGAALVGRFVRQPLTLTDPRDVALFLACRARFEQLVAASIATLVLDAQPVSCRPALADSTGRPGGSATSAAC